jgi:hypothetical protein
MTPGPAIASTEIDHPTLGPSVSVFDDRRGALRHLLMSAGMAAGGILGLIVGGNDLRTAEGSTGSLLVILGLLLVIYGGTEVQATIVRLRTRTSLIIGDTGFEDPSIAGPVAWEEVKSVDFETVGRGNPKAVRVQLDNPRDFAMRHELSRTARLRLKMNGGALYVARGALMPTPEVLELMDGRLGESRQVDREPGAPKRRPSRRSSRR